MWYCDWFDRESSPGPVEKDAYSIQSSLDDLELLIKKLNLRRFHLYGQSFGGILAFEYIKRIAERYATGDDANNTNDDDEEAPECLSVISSSSPFDVKQVEAYAGILMGKLLQEEDDMVSTWLAEWFRL